MTKIVTMMSLYAIAFAFAFDSDSDIDSNGVTSGASLIATNCTVYDCNSNYAHIVCYVLLF